MASEVQEALEQLEQREEEGERRWIESWRSSVDSLKQLYRAQH